MAGFARVVAVYIIISALSEIVVAQHSVALQFSSPSQFGERSAIQKLGKENANKTMQHFTVAYADNSSVHGVRVNQEVKTQPTYPISGIKLSGHPYSISVNPDTNMIYIAGILPKKIFFIDGNIEREINSISIPDTKPYNSSSFNSRILLLSAMPVNPTTNSVFVGYTDTNTIYVLDGLGGNVVAYDVIGNIPRALAADPDPKVSDVYAITDIIKPNQLLENKLYLINTFFNVPNYNITIGNNDILAAIAINPIPEGTAQAQYKVVYAVGEHNNLYVLHASDYSGLKLVRTISLNQGTPLSLWSVAFDPTNKFIYVTGHNSNSVYAINSNTYQVKTIAVGNNPEGVAVNPNTNMIYVANSASNNISIINGSTESVAATVPVDRNPRRIAVNPNTNRIYVANALSGTVPVMNGKTNKLMATLSFNTNPPNSGDLYCNGQRILSNFSSYDLGTRQDCMAVVNPGFSFSPWSTDLSSNSNITRTPMTVSDYLFGSTNPNNNPSMQLQVSHNGKLTANFVPDIPISLPIGFWGAISAIITDFFIPSIVSWLNRRMQRGTLLKYQTELTQNMIN